MLRVLRISFFTLVLAGAVLIGAGYLAEQRARAFSEKAVREIFAEWDYQAARRIMMKRMRESPRMDVEGPKVLQWGNEALGPLQDGGKPFGGIALWWGRTEDPHWLLGQYEFDARFKNGEANLEIGVVWEDWAWRISRYRFDSPALHGSPLGGGAPN